MVRNAPEEPMIEEAEGKREPPANPLESLADVLT